MPDTFIFGGKIIDGSGAPARSGALGIKDGMDARLSIPDQNKPFGGFRGAFPFSLFYAGTLK